LQQNQKSDWTGRAALLALMLALSPVCRANDSSEAQPAAQQVAQPANQSTVPPAASASGSTAPQTNGAGAAPADATVSPAPDAGAARSKAHRPAHRTAQQGIDANVRRLAKGLDLDQKQQATLRQILTDQYLQMTNLRTDSSPGMDRSGAMAAIVDRTKQRIRAMLNDEQKKKYSADVPREPTTPSRSDLEHWLDVRDANRKQGGEDPN
jgi:hypothetical protein